MTGLVLPLLALTAFAQQGPPQAPGRAPIDAPGLVGNPGNGTPGTPDGFTVWGGFHNAWTYNHRLNRLGSWIQQGTCGMTRDRGLSCDAASVHAAASGAGADTASWLQRATFIGDSGLHTEHGAETIRLPLTENLITTGSALVDVDLSGLHVPPGLNAGGKRTFTVLLGGFDIASVGEAGQFDLIEVGIDNESYNGATQTLSFEVTSAMRVECETAECGEDLLNPDPGEVTQFAYDVTVHWLVVTGDDLQITQQTLPDLETYPWTDHTPVRLDDRVRTRTLFGSPGWRHAAIGLRSFAVEVDFDHESHHHYQELDIATQLLSHDRDVTGYADYRSEYFFQGWDWEIFRPFSFKNSGNVVLNVDPVLLQFDHGCVDAYDTAGSVYWPADGSDPSTPLAEDFREAHRVPTTCQDAQLTDRPTLPF